MSPEETTAANASKHARHERDALKGMIAALSNNSTKPKIDLGERLLDFNQFKAGRCKAAERTLVR
jgi:hypothetical protein